MRGLNAQAQWNTFSDILGKLCDKNIPKITTKSQFQPPWFDSDVHNIGIKKERLRAKYKKVRTLRTTKNLKIRVQSYLKRLFAKK